MLQNSIISIPTKIDDHVIYGMKSVDDVVLNCTSVTGAASGELETFGITGAALQNTILDGAVAWGVASGEAVPFVTFPPTEVGVIINVGPGTFNGAVGATDGAKVVEFTGAIVAGATVDGSTGGLVGTSDPTMALQLGESKLAQMGVKEA